jgi:CBS domain containing-hemolysin-like protein
MTIVAAFFELAAVFLLVFLNGFFVAAEFSLVKARATQIEPLVREGSKRAKTAQQILARLDTYLSASQLGITMTSLGLGWVGEPFVAELLFPLFGVFSIEPAVVHGVSFVLAFSFITFLHIVLGEQAPKWLAIQHARETALTVARPLALFARVFTPFIWILNSSAKYFLSRAGIATVGESEVAQSEEELRLLLSKGKALTSTGKSISLRALALRDRMVREIMVPRTAVVYLQADQTIQENITRAIENQFTRYPLCEKNLDNVLGMIHIKDLFRLQAEKGSGAHLPEIRREILFVPETMPLEKCLNLFLSKRILMAIAVDEYGGTAGMVTLEDVLEELVGDIRDEFDVESGPIQKVSETELLVDGSMSLHDFATALGLSLDSRDVVTVSGFVFERLGKIPEKGASVSLGKWQGTVEAVERRKVKTLRVVKVPELPKEQLLAAATSRGKRKRRDRSTPGSA